MLDLSQFEGHTPGPWGVEEDDSFADCEFIPVHAPYGNGTTPIAEVQPCLNEDYDGFAFTDAERANARLIAAAPDLLAEVKRLRAMLQLAQPVNPS